MELFSKQVAEIEKAKIGDVFHDRKNNCLNKILAVIAPGVFVLSKNNDYTRVGDNKEAYTAREVVVDYNVVIVAGEKLENLEEELTVIK